MKTKLSSTLAGMFVVLALASFLIAGSASVAPVALAAPTTPTNSITVHAQDTSNGQVVVDSVTAAQAGWLLIRRDVNGAPGGVLGFAPVHQGVNTNISVDIRTTKANGDDLLTPTLFATLVPDPNALNAFASPDATTGEEGSVASVGFSSTAAGGAAQAIASAASQVPTTGGVNSSSSAANANKIVVRGQDVSTGQVIVDSVTATQDGWLLIRKDANGTPGGVIGFAPVHQGANTDVRVNIQLISRSGSDNLTRTLWATFVPDSNALMAFATPDTTVQEEGSAAMVGFSSTGANSAAQTSAAATSQALTTSGTSSSSNAANGNKIVLRAQDVSTGQVIADSVTVAQDGWLLIHKDANGAPGAVIGFAPVHPGVNTDVRVDIQLTDVNGNDNIAPTLWATWVADPNAAYPLQSPSADVQAESPLAQVGFASSPTGRTSQ